MLRLPRARLVWLTVAVLLLLAPVGCVLYGRAKRDREREARQAYYQSVLRSYTQTFKPGASRKQVETYLRDNGKPIVRMCCMNVMSAYNAYDTLTKIGEERAPWFCSEHNIYIGFEFNAQGAHKFPEAHDSDVLTTIRIYPWSSGCL